MIKASRDAVSRMLDVFFEQLVSVGLVLARLCLLLECV